MSVCETKSVSTDTRNTREMPDTHDVHDVRQSKVFALFQHPAKPSKKGQKVTPMIPVKSFTLVKDKGIQGSRFFGKNRQLTIGERETIDLWSAKLKCRRIHPGESRFNIETIGCKGNRINFIQDVKEAFASCAAFASDERSNVADYDSKEVKAKIWDLNLCYQLGETVVVQAWQLREPCWKMDAMLEDAKLEPGQVERTIWTCNDGHLLQDVIFRVVEGGIVKAGDGIKRIS